MYKGSEHDLESLSNGSVVLMVGAVEHMGGFLLILTHLCLDFGVD